MVALQCSLEKKYVLLRYSSSEDAAYFAIGMTSNKLNGSNSAFISHSFKVWKNAVDEKRGIIENIDSSRGHLKALELAKNFIAVMRRQKKEICSVISQAYSQKVA